MSVTNTRYLYKQDAKYEDDPEVTLYSEKSLYESGMGPLRVRNWKQTKDKKKPHNCVYASPVVSVAIHHSRFDIAAKKIPVSVGYMA